MKIIELDYRNIEKSQEPISICLGYFDGVHPGHIKIIKNALLNAHHKIGVLTFKEPISKYIDNGKGVEILTSIDDKSRLLSRYNVDYLYILNIDEKFTHYSPIEFIDKILKQLEVNEVFTGEDYRFGYKGEGDNSLLKKYFKTNVTPLEKINDEKISTRTIIKYLKEGKIPEVTKLLGRPYEIKGKVAKGNHVGHSIGFPTMNIELSHDYVIPKYGVYKVLAFIHGVPRVAIANVGVHPSIKERETPVLEVHVPNLDEDLYGTLIYVVFLDFIREEKKFDSLEELTKQIKEDLAKIY